MPPIQSLTLSIIVTIVLLIGGMMYFRRMEKFFADVA